MALVSGPPDAQKLLVGNRVGSNPTVVNSRELLFALWKLRASISFAAECLAGILGRFVRMWLGGGLRCGWDKRGADPTERNKAAETLK